MSQTNNIKPFIFIVIIVVFAVMATLNERKTEAEVSGTSAVPAICAPIIQAIQAADGKGQQKNWDAKTALAVVRAESDCRFDAVGQNTDGTIDRGYWQINSIHPGITPEQYGDPIASTNHAYGIYLAEKNRSGNGWKAWSSYNNGSYKKFL